MSRLKNTHLPLQAESAVPCFSRAHAVALSRSLAVFALAACSLLAISCGGASSGTPPAPSLARFEPDVVRAGGLRAFRLLGADFRARGTRVQVRCVAATGTPFLGGTSAVFDAVGKVESDVQLRGRFPDPGIPRQYVGMVTAALELVWPDGARVSGGSLRARFEPTQLVLADIAPRQLDGIRGDRAVIFGTGFDPVGGRAQIRFTARAGAPFHDAVEVEVEGTIESGRTIAFETPTVGPFAYGAHQADVTVTLSDADGAHVTNEVWAAEFLGPPPPPPLGVDAVQPSAFTSRAREQFTIEGTAFGPVGAVAVVRFTAEHGTPFDGNNAASLDVPAVVESASRMRGISPRVPDLDASVTTDVTVIFADGRRGSLPPGSMTFSAYVGAPRLVINEVDYDQRGSDTAEFIELLNAGDAPADLDGHVLELVNGSGGGAVLYDAISLPAHSLAAGAYFVIATSAAVVPRVDLDVATNSNLIQNGGPDAIALAHSGVLLDVLSYEGATAAPYREGEGTLLADPGATMPMSMARFLDGWDSDDNALDFEVVPPTPGAPNMGPGELPFAGNLASGTYPGHLIRWSTRSGRGAPVASVVVEGGLSGLAFASDGALVAVDRHEDESRLLHLRRDGSVIWNVGTVRADDSPVPVADITIHPSTGMIFALSEGAPGSGSLVTIDPVTSIASRVGATPLIDGERNGGLAFAPDGTLFMTTRATTARLLTIDPDTATKVSSVSLGPVATIGLCVRPSDGRLFGCAESTGELLWIAPNGTTTSVGMTGVGVPGAIDFRR